MAALDFGATSASTSSSASFLKRVGAGIWDVLVQMGHARARTAEMQYYMDMSDAELAEKACVVKTSYVTFSAACSFNAPTSHKSNLRRE